MKYLSAKETGEKWGISKARVCVLAREGRIEGAIKVGERWLIPDDAEKPLDYRVFRDASETDKKQEVPFPLWICKKEYDISHLDDYPEEEQKLYKAQLLLVSGHFQYANILLEKLFQETKTPVIKLFANYCLCLSYYCLGDFENYKKFYLPFTLSLSTSFAQCKEYQFLMIELESYTTGITSYIDNFRIDPLYFYSNEVLPFLYTQSAYYLLLMIDVNNTQGNPNNAEMQCQWLEREGYLFAAERIHLYLSAYYYFLSNSEMGDWHLIHALELAIRTKEYICIAEAYLSGPDYINKQLKNFSPDEQKKIYNVLNRFSNNVMQFYNYLKNIGSFFKLKTRDYYLIFQASNGMTSQEIADSLHLSVNTINKEFSRIRKIMNVSSKAEMIEFYKKSVLNY